MDKAIDLNSLSDDIHKTSDKLKKFCDVIEVIDSVKDQVESGVISALNLADDPVELLSKITHKADDLIEDKKISKVLADAGKKLDKLDHKIDAEVSKISTKIHNATDQLDTTLDKTKHTLEQTADILDKAEEVLDLVNKFKITS